MIKLLEKSIEMAKAKKRQREWKFCQSCRAAITEVDLEIKRCTNCRAPLV